MNESAIGERQYVVSTLGNETFGLDINKVREIIVYQEPTKMPGTSGQIEGIINLRGRIIPILSLRKKFGLTDGDYTRNTRIIVVETNENTAGIVVDSVMEVVRIPANAIEEPSLLISSGVDENYMTGVAKMDSGLVILLDLEKVTNNKMAKAV